MKPLLFRGRESYGIVENLLAAFIFFSPNFFLLFDFLREQLYVFLIYDFVVIFLITSAMAHFRFYNGEK